MTDASTAEELKASADLAALLPVDHALARLGRMRLDLHNRYQAPDAPARKDHCAHD